MTAVSTGATMIVEPDPAFDDDGFLRDPSYWSEDLAQHLANLIAGTELTEAHWRILYFVRSRVLRTGAIPPMRIICRQLGQERDAVKGLFGGCLNLWRIAGLPNPGEEAKAHMD